MLKTISAALLAASMIAAPAFAAGTGKTAQTSPAKTEQAQANVQAKNGALDQSAALNANAKMHRHYHKYHKMGGLKKKSHVNVGFNRSTQFGKTHLGKTHLSKSRMNKTHMSKIRVTKSHSKVSFRHAAPASKRG
jgi:Ni/Co efflux regulator RcnB